MRLEAFFEKFELFADAPNAVGKMRELVLQLAIQGKLVDQKHDDGGATLVLTAISRERDAGAARVRTPEEPASANGNGRPFQIPSTWAWTQLGNIALQIQYGYTASADPSTKEIRMLRITDIQNNRVDWPSVPGCQIEQGEAKKYLLSPNDILIARTGGTIGKSFIVPDAPVKSVFASYLIRVIPPQSMAAQYLKNFLESPFYWTQLRTMSAGTGQPNVNGQALGRLEIPIPPHAEQKRIVAKVDELMALCNRLEAQQQERDTRHAALARASLTRFAEAPTPANLNFLFNKSYPITPADLRKAILSLAVQGKLVAQEPDDEPAETCLPRLGLKCTLDPVDGSDQTDDSLPPSWGRVRFEDVALVAGGVTLGRKLGARKTVSLPYLRVANVKRGEIDLCVIKEVSIVEDEIERYALRENDLLMTEGGDWDKVGRAAIWKAQIPVCLHQNHVFRARMRSAEIVPVWFERYFNSPDGRRYFESASKQTTNLASINMRQVRGCPVPFPPLAEQRRIVAKVAQLMTMVDQLEAQLAEAKAKSTALLESVIHELLNPSVEIVDLAAYRAAMGCYAIRKMASKPYFGRTAAMKLFYLAQAHVGLELDLRPLRDAAGPLDQWIYDFEREGVREDWFRVAESNTANGRKKIAYQPGRTLAEKSALAERLLSVSQRKEYDRLLSLFADRTTEEVEIIATLFAAWNDLLIDGRSPSDDQIVTEVREHWHEKKARFTPTVLRQWLAWLRQNNLVPTGRLPHTVHQPQLLLN